MARYVRSAARTLRKAPGFTLSVVLTLAVGIGLGVPVLGLVRAGLLQPSPYTDSLLHGDGAAPGWLSGWSDERRTIAEIQGEALEVLLWVVLALALSLLGIALIDLATLLLSRAAIRRPEIALRAVLGAVWRRLVGQLLAEGALLVLLGGGLGLLIGAVASYALQGSWPHGDVPWGGTAVDGRVLAAVAGGFILVTLLSWLSPVGVAWRRDLRRFLAIGVRATAGRGEAAGRNALAVVQVAGSLILLTSAGLLLRGFASPAADAREVGFDPRDTLTVQLRLPEAQSLSSREQSLLYERIRHRIAAIPGVVDTSMATRGAWVGLGTSDLVHGLTGNPIAPGWVKPARYHAVGPGFFRTLGAPVLHGRELGVADDAEAPRVAVVNEAFVSQFRLVGNGVGRTLQPHGVSVDGPSYTIVGVVEDIRPEGLGSDTEPVPKVYLSALQHPPNEVGLAVRTTDDPMEILPAVEEAVRAVAPEAELSGAMTMEQYLARFRAPLRWFAVLFGVLAVGSLLLTALGLHGVMSYNVSRRTREIGIRMALGAQVRDMTRMIVGQSLRITVVGAGLGLIGVVGLARLLQLLFSGVDLWDPVLYGVLAGSLAAVAVASSYRPARRAASVDPQISLRAE